MKLEYTEENRAKLYESIAFINNLSSGSKLSVEQFASACIDVFKDGVNFIENLAPLLKTLEAFEIPAERMLAGEDFKDDIELFYLAIAPSCMNENNRIKIDFDFSCTNGLMPTSRLKAELKENSKAMDEAFRAKIVRNLLKGMPVGNSFQQPGGNHINTIVGVRYNSENNKCEYKIRESQTGRSTWQDESPIIERMYELTEVEKL